MGSLLLLSLVTGALLSGRYPLTREDLAGLIQRSAPSDPRVSLILFKVRLPRVMAALSIGAGLSGAGALFQTVFKNPMVSPSVMGASSGASFGAALALLWQLPRWSVQMGAFVSGALAVLLAMAIASLSAGRNRILLLVLAGMLVSSFFTALISLIKFTADPLNTLPSITFWLMGSLAGTDGEGALFTGGVILAGALILYALRWRITALSLDDDEISVMGINPVPLRYLVLLAAALMTSAAVALGGVIGWVGLVVPHLVRLIWPGRRFGEFFLKSLWLGAAYLLLIDTVFRTVTAMEIPLGIMTALIGAPFFALFILRKKRGVS